MARKLINSALIILIVFIYGAISDIQWGVFSTTPKPLGSLARTEEKKEETHFSHNFSFKRNAFQPKNQEITEILKKSIYKKSTKRMIPTDTLAIISSNKKTKYLIRQGGKICIR